MITLSNDILTVCIAPKGAELQSIQKNGTEYLWQGDPAWWNRRAPVLFPVVGRLAEDTLRDGDTTTRITQHGFARDAAFETRTCEGTKAVFVTSSDDSTRFFYPWDFQLEIGYQLEGNVLENSWKVTNPGHRMMYFSIGAHPAFRAPLEEGEVHADFDLIFEQPETAPRWLLRGGLLSTESTPCLDKTQTLPVTHDLFHEGALVFKGLASSHITLQSRKSGKGVRVHASGFPHMGIWAPDGEAPFVCIEPWFGHADPVGFAGDFSAKPGVIALEPGASFSASFRMEIL